MRILFTFVTNWQNEVTDYERGLVPAHRLFGFADLREMGHEPRLCPTPRWLGKLAARPLVWRLYQTLYALTHQRKFDCIFAVNEGSALPLLVLKRFGLLRTPLMVFSVALTHQKNMSGKRHRLWSFLLPGAEAIISQTTMELEKLLQAFGLRRERQHLLHMTVDRQFFQRDPAVEQRDYVLAVGTTDARDFPTLLAALPAGQRLIIVTDPYNAAIIEQHRQPGMQIEVRQAVRIAELKRMYQEAKAIAIPLHDTPFGSGHTFLLENMVLGNVCIVTDVPGISEYFEHGVSALGVKLHDPADFAEKLRAVLETPERFGEIRRRAPEWVEPFTSRHFAGHLQTIAQGILRK